MTFKSRSATARGYSLVEILIVVGIIGVVSVIAVPMIGNQLGYLRLSGDVRSLSNATAVVKMRAASAFARSRLFVDLTARTHHLETWDSTAAHWATQGGTSYLSTGVSFGFGAVGAPPPNTQTVIAEAPLCTTDLGVTIANTACVMFNSRGVPVDSGLNPTALDAIYLTDGTAVYAVTVAATGMIRTWQTPPTGTPTWTLN